jgi:thiol-disulfide isomerase/thioredoxin
VSSNPTYSGQFKSWCPDCREAAIEQERVESKNVDKMKAISSQVILPRQVAYPAVYFPLSTFCRCEPAVTLLPMELATGFERPVPDTFFLTPKDDFQQACSA